MNYVELLNPDTWEYKSPKGIFKILEWKYLINK